MAQKTHAKARHIQAGFLFFVVISGIFVLSVTNTVRGITGAVTAEEVFSDDLLSFYMDTYNEKASGLPDIVFIFFGEEVINIYVSDLDYNLYALLEDGELVELEPGTQESPTIEIETTYDTLVALQNDEMELSDAIDAGLLTFSSDSFVKEAELAVVLYSIDIYDIFS
jgi:hypothetical protein